MGAQIQILLRPLAKRHLKTTKNTSKSKIKIQLYAVRILLTI